MIIKIKVNNIKEQNFSNPEDAIDYIYSFEEQDGFSKIGSLISSSWKITEVKDETTD